MTLSNEQLERMAIDRRLGELSEEAALLLDAYCAQNPDAAGILVEINESLSLAGAALSTSNEMEEDDPLPAPKFLLAAEEPLKFRRIMDGLAGFSIAAAIAIMAWIGFGVSSTAPGQSQPEIVAEVPAQDAETSSTGFWSLSALRQDLSNPGTTTHSPTFKWTGPITRPKIGA